MSTKFSCPQCSYQCDYLEIKMEEDLLAVIKLSRSYGNHSALVWAYCELFGILPLRTKAKKLRLLLEEMYGLFQAEAFAYQKKRYTISQAGIAEALGIVTHRHWTDRLDNHNYLKKVMIQIADREEQERGRRAEKNLRDKEDRLRSGNRDDDEYLTEEQIAANKQRLRDLHKSLGG